MRTITNPTIVGTAIVFGVMGRTALYKVDLSEVALVGDFRLASCYEPSAGAWRACELTRDDDAALIEDVWSAACELAPEVIYAWEQAYTAHFGSQQADTRIGHLVDTIMLRFDRPRRAIASRLGIQDRVLRQYCEGKSTGSMGPALELALTALASRPRFD